jgi:LacI family transcriptional regulator
VHPIPPKLVTWLRELPKPVGILAPELGWGGYLIRCCQAMGLRVPEDVAVIGGDDMDLSLSVEPTLTSVVPALETLGFEAVRILRELVAGRRPANSIVRLGCIDLHVRESTGLRRPEICDIGAALKCIHENACRGISVEQVIKQTQHVSRVTFHRRFRASVGKSPAEAIRDRKLDEARRLLTSTDLPLTMVSDLCGFSSAKVLTRVFRAVEATTPREFRKTQKPSKARTVRAPRRPFSNGQRKHSSRTPSLRPQKRTNGQGMTSH